MLDSRYLAKERDNIMSLHTVPYESFRLFQMGMFYLLTAFALAGVRARLLTPVAVTLQNPERSQSPSVVPLAEMVTSDA